MFIVSHHLRLSREEKLEEGRCNYERYRSLVQNKFHGVSESEALARIEVEEMYPSTKNKDKGKQKLVFDSSLLVVTGGLVAHKNALCSG